MLPFLLVLIAFAPPTPAAAPDSERAPERRMAFLADGRTLAVIQRDDALRLYDAVTGKPLRKLPLSARPLDLAANPTSAQIAIVDADGRLVLLNLETGADRILASSGPEAKLTLSRNAFSTDGRRLVAGQVGQGAHGQASVLQIWNLEKPEKPLRLDAERRDDLHAGFIDADLAYSLAPSTGELRLWRAASGEECGRVTARVQQPANLPALVGHAAGQLVVGGGFSADLSQVRRWRLADLRELLPLAPRNHTTEIIDWELSRDARTLFAAHQEKARELSMDNMSTSPNPLRNRVFCWDLEKGERVGTFHAPSAIRQVALSPDESVLAVAIHDQILLWDLKVGK